MRRSRNRPRGLTAWEILLAISLVYLFFTAVTPSFQKTRLKSRVSRARVDLRSMALALDVYRVDFAGYPPSVDSPDTTQIAPTIYGVRMLPPLVSHRMALTPLTTPIAYLPTVDFDSPFPARAWEITEAERRSAAYSYWYNNYSDFYKTARGFAVAPLPRDGYMLLAFGPLAMGVEGISAPYPDILVYSAGTAPALSRPNVNNVYDPTNGLRSYGNMMRFGGRIGLEEGVPYH